MINILKCNYNKAINVALYKNNIGFIPIHKNASNTIKQKLKAIGFIEKNIINDDTIKYSIIIREPIISWIKGLTTRIMICILNNQITFEDSFNFLENDTNKIFEIVEFDVHTRPQIEYINLVKDIKIYPMDYMDKINGWFLKYNIKVEIPKPHFQDCFSICGREQKIYDKLKKIIFENSQYFNIIKNYYKQDIEIYNKILKDTL
ncbi:MAG: hypothetical protein ACFFDN_02110 [Candidatus Hodarchaeota archaeon]